MSYQHAYNPANTTTFEKPHIVSITASTEDQAMSENEKTTSPSSASQLDKKLQVAQSRLQQEDLHIHARDTSNQMEAKVGNIDQVRDLLFGGHVRDSDKRFKRLEERFTQDSMTLREEIFNRIKALEERFDTEIEELSERVKFDRQDGQSSLQNFEHEIKLLKNELTNRIVQLDDKLSYELKTLRQQMHKSTQDLALQIRQQNDNLTNFITQEVGQLHDEKVNRNDLAAFFNEFAIHLTRNYETGDTSE